MASGRGSDNLRLYLGHALLPQMVLGVDVPEIPPDGHKSHSNTLTVRPEPYRKLESIYAYRLFYRLVLEWVEGYVPFESLGVEDEDETTGERLSVPAGGNCSIPPIPLKRPSEISQVCVWVDQLPLETVQRIIHLVYPEIQTWRFVHNEVLDIDKDIFRHIEWKDCSQSRRSRLIIVIQPPWILSPQDMQSFVECRMFHISKDNHRFDSKYRLWGKIWDLCVRQNCPWFSVSTYDRWVFGVFSQGWTRAFVTPVFEWNHKLPTVLQVLTYWIASAMDLPGAWTIPEFPDTVKNLTMNISLPPPKEDSLFFAPSESSWAGTDAAGLVSSSAGVTATPVLSEADKQSHSNSNTSYLQHEDIRQWANTALPGSLNAALPTFIPSSPAGTANTAWSELTADAGDSVANLVVNSTYRGDWMSLPLSRRAETFQLAE